jgi:hypothetical protein
LSSLLLFFSLIYLTKSFFNRNIGFNIGINIAVEVVTGMIQGKTVHGSSEKQLLATLAKPLSQISHDFL